MADVVCRMLKPMAFLFLVCLVHLSPVFADSHWVIYSRADVLKNCGQGSWTLLGCDNEGAWAVVPVKSIPTIFNAHPNTLVLYFSPKNYEHAMRGLEKSDVTAAVAHRRLFWAPYALDKAVGWLIDGQYEILSLTANISKGCEAKQCPRLDTYFAQSLQWVAMLTGQEDNQRVTWPHHLQRLMEQEAMLLHELKITIEAVARTGLKELAAAAKRQQNHAEERVQWLGRTLVQLGLWKGDADILPYVQINRGVYIHPADKAFIDALAAMQRPALAWNKGVITTLSRRRRQALIKSGRTIEVLYLEGSRFVQESGELTPLQLDRELADRHQNPPKKNPAALISHLGEMMLHLAIMRREALIHAERQQSDLLEMLKRQVETETKDFLDWLAMALPNDDPDKPSISSLLKAEDRMVEDLNALAFLAELKAWPQLSSLLKRAGILKKEAVKRLCNRGH